MEGEPLSYCFICGGSFQVKESPLMRRCDSVKDLKELVLRLCGLLGVEVTPGEWEEVDGDYLMKQTIACDKCFEILRNVERVHEVLLKTQQELKVYLDEVESLIIRSETPNLQVSFWRSSCFKLRRSVLEKAIPAANIEASENSLQILIKEECYGDQSAQTFYEDPTVDNHFIDDDWDASLPYPHPDSDSGQIILPSRLEDIPVPPVPANITTAEPPTTTRKNRKRKITVIAEEDEVPDVKDVPNPVPPTETKRTRSAKKIAAVSLQLYTSSGHTSDNDSELSYNPNVNHLSIKTEPNERSNDANPSGDSEEEALKEESALEKARRHKKRLPLPKDSDNQNHHRGQIRQFMLIEENLYLYRWDSFVLYTRSHLECLAHKCGFKTEFDYFPSFQRMRTHMEEKHRNMKHRQRTPHPCIPCNKIYKNREDFNNHFNEAHSAPQRAVCECCLMIHSRAYLPTHMFTHKNSAEKADAIAKNLIPGRCLRRLKKKNNNEGAKNIATASHLDISSRDAEEDEVTVVKGISVPSPPKETRKTRKAKKVSASASSLQLNNSSSDSSSDNDNDMEYNPNSTHPSPQTDSRLKEEDASDDSEDEDETLQDDPALEKARRHKRLPPPGDSGNQRPKRGEIKQFMVIEDNLYLYRGDSYVLYTRSHLECLAHKCGFKTEFDFYPSFQRMRAHMEEKHRDRRHRQRTPHPCIPCKKTYKNREDFTNHFNEAHSEPQRVVCECCLMIASRSYMPTHMFTHKNSEEKADAIAKNLVPGRFLRRARKQKDEMKYSCPYENCTYATNEHGNLKRHQRSHLPKEQRSDYAICPECGFQMLRERLNSHIQRLHHPETIDRFLQCSICDKKFPFGDRSRFDTHMRKHTGEKPFLCPECGKSYSDQGSLTYHLKNQHDPNPQEWPCQWCDMVYLKKGTLNQHMVRKHPDKRKPGKNTRKRRSLFCGEEEEVKGEVYGPKQMFPCPYCDIICGYNFTLKKHLFRKHGIGEIRKKQGRSYYRRTQKEDEEEKPYDEGDNSRSMSAEEEREDGSGRGEGGKSTRSVEEKFPGSSSNFFHYGNYY